jgi:hypothetical protein
VNPATQSPLPTQVVWHVSSVLQVYGPQLAGVCLHVPAPLQKPTGVNVDPVQDAVPHEVTDGAFWQAPAPSQVPTRPHGGFGTQRPWGSAASSATSLQVPARPATLQAWQVPQLPVEQQTPSTHELPVRHSPSLAQV